MPYFERMRQRLSGCVLILVLGVTACSSPPVTPLAGAPFGDGPTTADPVGDPTTPTPTPVAAPTTATPAKPAAPQGRAPSQTYPVGVRQLALNRGGGRP